MLRGHPHHAFGAVPVLHAGYCLDRRCYHDWHAYRYHPFSAQVINGIGFLGAGTIIVTGHQAVKGLTTAAALWASACMGLVIGAGYYECVFLGFVLIFFCVRILNPLETYLIEKSRNMNLYIEFESMDDVRTIAALFELEHIKLIEEV